MRKDREYSDIPGTYVFDPDHSMQGYELNMFCMSLNSPDNRDKFRQDEVAYLDGFPLTSEQRQAVLTRDWIGLLRLGGNIYYTFKLAIFDRNFALYSTPYLRSSSKVWNLEPKSTRVV